MKTNFFMRIDRNIVLNIKLLFFHVLSAFPETGCAAHHLLVWLRTAKEKGFAPRVKLSLESLHVCA